jgi:hypothetical protein
VSTKTYPVILESVAEAALAIPYAYERSGYISQALEAYLEASTGFESELRTIDKVDAALEKYSASKVLIDGSEVKGLEWFLAKGVAKNTTRAAYYSYFVQDLEIHDEIKLFSEMRTLLDSIEFWESQLSVFDRSLKSKRDNFAASSQSFNPDSISREIKVYDKTLRKLASNNSLTPNLRKDLKIDAMANGIDTLGKRLESLSRKVANGKKLLNAQLNESVELAQRLNAEKQTVKAFLQKLDKEITDKCRTRLGDLRKVTLSNYERAEQGLVHIFQNIAEKGKAKRSKTTGRGNK